MDSAAEEKPREDNAVECGQHEQVSRDHIPEGMSKNQWKKRLKQQRIEQGKAEWKKRLKERDRAKKLKRWEEGVVRGPIIKKQKMNDCPFRVAIELGYQHLMTDLDIKSLMKQCQRCYAANRRAVSPLQLYFTSFGGRFKQKMEEIVQGHVNWDVYFKSGDYVEEFGSENIVCLAAESPNILRDLAPDKVYVIGGLVDHNHHKGHCYQSAVSKGIAHAQLPISEYITLNSRKVLTVNHVFEILVAFVQCQDWKMAFNQVIPLRKQANHAIQSPSHTSSLGSQPRHCVTEISPNFTPLSCSEDSPSSPLPYSIQTTVPPHTTPEDSQSPKHLAFHTTSPQARK